MIYDSSVNVKCMLEQQKRLFRTRHFIFSMSLSLIDQSLSPEVAVKCPLPQLSGPKQISIFFIVQDYAIPAFQYILPLSR